MSFSESGGVITQTGIDTDLSGLIGLTGVTTRTVAQTVYTLDNTDLRITGTLSYNGSDERLEYINVGIGTSARSLTVTSTGVLTITASRTATKPFYPAIDFGSQAVGGTVTSARSFTIDTGGVCSLEGLYIIDAGSVSGGTMYINGILNLDNCLIINLGTAGSTQITSNTGGTVNAINTTFRRLVINAEKVALGTWDEFLFYECVECLVPRTQGTTELLVELANINYENISNYFARIRVDSGKVCFKVTNMLGGDTVPIASTNDNPTVGQNYYLAYQTVNYSFVDSGGSPVTAKIYGKDVDNGSRIPDFTINGSPFTVASDIEYTTNDTTSSFDVLYQLKYSNLNEGINWSTVDNRGVGDTAIVKFNAINYNYNVVALPDFEIQASAYDATGFFITDSLITETTKATVDAYLKLGTPQKLYDRAKSYLYDNFAGETETILSRNGETIDAGDYDIVIDPTAISAFSITGNTITINANDYTGNLTTTGTITLETGARILGTATDSTGTTKTLEFSITGLIANSRVQLYNVTTDTEIYNDIVTGTSLTGDYTEGVEYTTGDTVRLRVSHVIGLTCYVNEQVNAIISSSGFSIKVYPAVCPVYTDNGIDGSTVTEYSSDYPNVQVDIDDPDGVTTVQRLFAWYRTNEYTEDGIRNFFNGLTAEDSVNYKIQTSIVDLMLDNVGDPVLINGARLYRDDDTTVIASGSIQIDPDKAYIANSSTVQSELVGIKAKTDLLNFTGTDVQSIASNMRGTDGANTIAPDNNSITDILADTNELQTNQSNWVTATGFSTPSNITDAQTAIQGSISALNDFDPSNDIVANVTLVDTVTTNTDMRGTDGANTIEPDNAGITSNGNAIANLNDFDPTTDEVITNTASREASKADVSLLATSAQINALNNFDPSSDIVAHVTLVDTVTTNTDMRGTDDALLAGDYTAPDNTEIITDLNIINVGVQKASKLIPHGTDL